VNTIKRTVSIMLRSLTRGVQAIAPVNATSGTEGTVLELFRCEPNGRDLLWAGPTTMCLCGNEVFHALIWFNEDREIGGYFTEMMCAFCGSILRGATPVDEVLND